MIELLGFQLGSVFQGATLLTLLAVVGAWWIRGMPDRKRADNEEKIIDHAEGARKELITRAEVHKLKNDIQKCIAAQTAADRKYIGLEKLHATSVVASAARRDQIDSMMSLIEMLIAEIERLDTESIIVPQAQMLAKQMRASAARAAALLQPLIRPDPDKSAALDAAEHTVAAAKVAVAEVKEAENGK